MDHVGIVFDDLAGETAFFLDSLFTPHQCG
jgi:hypothetical protein